MKAFISLKEVLRRLHFDSSTFEKVKVSSKYQICALCNAQGDRSARRVTLIVRTPSLNGNWPDRYLCSQCAVKASRINSAIAEVLDTDLSNSAIAATAKTESKNAIAVQRLDTGETYPSISAAARATGVATPAIIRSIEYGWRSGGAHWIYLKEQEPAGDTKARIDEAVLCVLNLSKVPLAIRDIVSLLEQEFTENQVRTACKRLSDRGAVKSFDVARTRMFYAVEVAHAS